MVMTDAMEIVDDMMMTGFMMTFMVMSDVVVMFGVKMMTDVMIDVMMMMVVDGYGDG